MKTLWKLSAIKKICIVLSKNTSIIFLPLGVENKEKPNIKRECMKKKTKQIGSLTNIHTRICKHACMEREITQNHNTVDFVLTLLVTHLLDQLRLTAYILKIDYLKCQYLATVFMPCVCMNLHRLSVNALRFLVGNVLFRIHFQPISNLTNSHFTINLMRNSSHTHTHIHTNKKITQLVRKKWLAYMILEV